MSVRLATLYRFPVSVSLSRIEGVRPVLVEAAEVGIVREFQYP